MSRDERGDVSDLVRRTMWRHVGIERSAGGLMTARHGLVRPSREGDLSISDRNLLLIAGLITTAALERTESRGAHYRTDFLQPDPSRSRRSFVDPEPVERRPLPVPAGSSAA
jgi:L-aspartate oxidase